MLLTVPSLRGGPAVGYSVLGFGDVVLPGLLLVYTRIFDLRHRLSLAGGYFVPAAIGYGCGLGLTFAALLLELFGDQVSLTSLIAHLAVGRCSRTAEIPCQGLQNVEFCSCGPCKTALDIVGALVLHNDQLCSYSTACRGGWRSEPIGSYIHT